MTTGTARVQARRKRRALAWYPLPGGSGSNSRLRRVAGLRRSPRWLTDVKSATEYTLLVLTDTCPRRRRRHSWNWQPAVNHARSRRSHARLPSSNSMPTLRTSRPPWGTYGHARSADHPQNRRARVRLELGCEGKFTAKSSGWGENRVFLEGDKIELAVKNGRRGAYALPASRPNCCDAIFRAPETVLHRW
jgi:hypothetical protein